MGLLSRQPWIVALLIALLIGGWMLSGMATSVTPGTAATLAAHGEAPLPRVQVTRFSAQPVSREVSLYGRTEPDRQVTVRSETRGQVTEVLVERGARVKQGQPLARLALNDREQQLAQARALLTQRELEYNGTVKLKNQGYQADIRLAEKETQLKEARARVKSLELDLANTVVRAPFAGVLNLRHIEVGDYLRDGDRVADVVDVDPLVVRADVTETAIGDLTLGQGARVRFVDGSFADGQLRYISQVADSKSNTFRIEVAIPNGHSGRLAGMSAELTLPVATEQAIKVSPALLALDEDGNMGLKQVEGGKVKFTAAQLVKSEPDGIWLGGLGDNPVVITLGAGFVRDGDAVEAVFSEPAESK